MEHYELLMGDVHVAVVARAVWERLPKAERPGKYADAQFVCADVDTLCGFLAESFVDEDERARAAEFLNGTPALTEQVVSLLQTEDPKWPHLSGNAGLGAMQLRFCWACKEGALGIGNGTMMVQKRVEKHVASAGHKAAVLRLRAVEHQAQLCSQAFGKHERAKERGEDIGHKEHQKRLKAGKPVQAVSAATRQSQQDRLVQDFQAEQLQEIATGVLNPHPVPAAQAAPELNPLCEPSGILQPAQKREEPTPPARELRFDGYTAEARLQQPIGIDHMRSCAKATEGRYTPQSNASIIVYEKSGDLGATVTVNTSGLLMCMGAPSPEAAKRAIGTVAGRIGPVREGSLKITNITGGAHLGVVLDRDVLAAHLGVNFEGEFESYVTYRHGEATACVYASGSVRVAGRDERAAMTAYLHVRNVVFGLKNDAMPEITPVQWFALLGREHWKEPKGSHRKKPANYAK
jgi:TATA-box binding protein (TBP) (component of TFIID and TFIIIB)